MRAFAEDAATRAWARLRTVRNRGFRSRLRHRPDAPALILSPHPDDAVIDCWSILTDSRAVEVLNVFAGSPAPGELAYYDRLAGARDSAEHLRRRIAEDREALGLAGRSPRNLGFLARSYRRGRPEPSFAQLDAALLACREGASLVCAPAALGTPHPDHELVRAYALRLAMEGMPVRLYADLPYCGFYGWPSWVSEQEANPSVDVDAYWEGSAGQAAGLLTRDRAEVVRLDAGQATAKLAAMRAYRAEFAVLDRGPVGQLSNPAIHGYEVFWSVGNGAG
ncbi:MAG: PIG-L deacetylase family protein [Thermoleophilaceae bacterium]